MIKRALAYIKRNYLFVLLIFFLVALTTAPWMRTGVIISDEVNQRMVAMKGFPEYIAKFSETARAQGRLLMAFSGYALTYINFLLDSSVYFEAYNTAVNLLCITLFCILIYKLMKSRGLSILLGVMLLAFMPVTFEHTIPNAFNGGILTPFVFMQFSMLMFAGYLEGGNRRALFISLPLLFIALMAYESLIMLMPMYFIISARLGAAGGRFFKPLKRCAPYIMTSFLYLSAYIAARIAFPSGYGGTQFGFVSLESSFNIIKQLFLSGIPGYYLTHKSSQYIFLAVNSGLVSQALGGGYGAALKYMILNALNMRILLLCAALPIIFTIVFRQKDSQSPLVPKPGLKSLLPYGLGLLFMILPAIPNAMALHYQGSVNPNDLAALPSSYFIYLAAGFLISLLIWRLAGRLKGLGPRICLIAVLTLCVLPVQTMNGVLASEQRANYNRMVSIEKFISTDAFKRFASDRTVYAPDFYEKRWSLAIPEGHWTIYAQLRGLKAKINGVLEDSEAPDAEAYLNGDDYFSIIAGDRVAILSPRPLSGMRPVRVGQDAFLLAECGSYAEDGPFYAEYFILENGMLTPVDGNAPISGTS